MTRPPLLIAAATVALGLGFGVPASSEEEAPEKVAIEFSPAALTPEVARVRSGAEVSWVNKATGRNGFVVFPLSIESDFTCRPLAPAFHEIGAGWRSAPITRKGASPCPAR